MFVDETGSDPRNYNRRFGYSLCGMRAECHRNVARGKRVSAIAAMDCTVVIEVELTTGTVNSDFVFDFVSGSLLPQLQPFDGTSVRSVVVLDNCSIHHIESIYEIFESARVLLLFFLLSYSPDLMPIKVVFSCVKSYLKKHNDCIQATNDPFPIIHAAFQSITSEQCHALISHAIQTNYNIIIIINQSNM